MKKLSRASAAVFGLLCLSSCALPPREAWRVVQRDGLFPYIAVEMGKRPVPTYVHVPSARSSRFVTLTSSAKSPGSAVASGTYVKRPAYCLVGNSFFDTTPGPVVAPKPMTALAPAPVVKLVPAKPQPVVAIKPAPKPKLTPAPVVQVSGEPVKPAPMPPPVARPSVTPKPSINDEIASAPKAKKADETPAPVTRPKLPPNPTPAPNPDRVVAGKPMNAELPFGSPIPGRPGLVNSPFAGKNQLVDVTGLEPGQEVKCPYSGRLFRVPGVKQAKSDVKTELEPPPAGKKKD